MTYQGTVKGGKLELERPLDLPEGTRVYVEVIAEMRQTRPATQSNEEWLEEWRRFAQEVTEASSDSSQSALDVLYEMRESRERSILGRCSDDLPRTS